MAIERRIDCFSGEETDEPFVRPAPTVPERVTRHQFRRALSQVNAGKRTQFEAWLINSANESDQDYFRDAGHISRNAVAVENARLALGVSKAAIDNVFLAALAYDE